LGYLFIRVKADQEVTQAAHSQLQQQPGELQPGKQQQANNVAMSTANPSRSLQDRVQPHTQPLSGTNEELEWALKTNEELAFKSDEQNKVHWCTSIVEVVNGGVGR
jgi:hypothetical protein